MEELINKLSEEEKKAIEYYNNNEYTFGFEVDMDMEEFKKAIGIEETEEDTFEKHQMRFKTLLNLIEKQQEQLQEKDKIIDLMAEMITEAKFCYFKKEKGGELLGEYRCYNKDEWIEYFTKKAREV